mgnify:CR=1 FL=1
MADEYMKSRETELVVRYQGGHNEYFTYMTELLKLDPSAARIYQARGAEHFRQVARGNRNFTKRPQRGSNNRRV